MSFIVRSVESDDVNSIYDLAKQFTLLNLPADKKVVAEKIERSLRSFSGEETKENSEYMLVVEDVEAKFIAGCSQIIAKHGSKESPHLYFKVLQKNHVSNDLGVGFIHKVLRFSEDFDGPTEIGGLLVDRSYRRRPEKIGKQISLSRFLLMAMEPHRFTDRVLCELTPPLTDEGRSEFWEALGRRFTGMPYQEADQISQVNKEFITQLFPAEDIYTALLDSKARLVLGQVGQATRPAQHLLESIGFKYLEEVDPFDGGPHYGAAMSEISLVKNYEEKTLSAKSEGPFDTLGLVAKPVRNGFYCLRSSFKISGESIELPQQSIELLGVSKGEKVGFTTLTS